MYFYCYLKSCDNEKILFKVHKVCKQPQQKVSHTTFDCHIFSEEKSQRLVNKFGKVCKKQNKVNIRKSKVMIV